VDLAEAAADSSLRTILLQEVAYDGKGLPQFHKTLEKRPRDPGERFTLALFQNTRLLKTFDIAIRRPHGDFMVPLRTLYRWTGKGFMAGAVGGAVLAGVGLAGADAFDYDRDISRPVGVALVVPVVIGTMSGFIKGLMEGLPSGWAESQKIVLRAREVVVTCTEYEYNALGQLSHMAMSDPGTGERLVRTDFYYEDGRDAPAATYIKSYPENKVRVIDDNGTRAGDSATY
jgi:hypothetical protein